MATHLLLVSLRKQDIQFAERLSKLNEFPLKIVATSQELANCLIDHPQTITLWDADHEYAGDTSHPQSVPLIGRTLENLTLPQRVFAITDTPLNSNPVLLNTTAFGHHMFRRYESPAPELYAKLTQAAVTPRPFGLSTYMPGETQTQKLTLKKSSQRKAAVEAMQNVLDKSDVTGRLSALVAQALDQLLMNAIFDAPQNPPGTYIRKFLPRSSDFELNAKEQVTLEFARNDDLIGISVLDQWGTLRKEVVMSFLRKDYQKESVKFKATDPGSGLGLHGITQSGLSMLFVSRPKNQTEVMLFFPRTNSYKTFRSGFRFLSIISE
jgi:hypothetical protein